MKRETTKVLVVLAALLAAIAFSASATAQSDPWPSRPPPGVAGPGVHEDDPLEKHLQGGLSLGVPVFLDVDRDVVKPGVNLLLWGGLDIGYVLFALQLGFQWNTINLDAIPGQSGFGRDPLRRIMFAPEIRFQVPVLKRVLPYLSGAFDLNWWSFRESQIICDFYYCTETRKYRFTPGFTAKGGTGIEIRNGIYIDFGLKFSVTGEGDFFQQSRFWFEPYVGVLVRRAAPWR